MMRHPVLILLGVALSLTIAARAGMAETYHYTDGHADIGAGYEGNQLHLHFHAEGAMLNGVAQSDEFEVADIVTVVPPMAKTSRPASSQWDFLGVPAGSNVYILSSSNQTGVPFLGLGAEEISKDVFVNGEITFALTGIVSMPAGGNFSLYQFDSFGTLVRRMDTADGLFANDSFQFLVGGHDHANWAFTVPGEYKLQWTVSGNLAAGGSTSHSGVLTFQVVPEPGTIALLLGSGMIGLGAVVLRRKRGG